MTTKTAPAKKTVAMPPADKACKKHKAFTADNCPSCGTAAKIPTTTPVRKTAAKKATPASEKKPAAAKKQHPLPDGFTLGQKVVASKDGLTYEVVGGDKSPLYIALRGADNKRVIRAIKTLTPVKTAARKTPAKKTAAAK